MANPSGDLLIRISTSPVESREPEGSTTAAHQGLLNSDLHRWLIPGTEVILLFDRYIARTAVVWLEAPGLDAQMEGCVRLLGVSSRSDTDCPEI